jgi:acetyltransferase-like isoleucine patch superfamily enzyme
MAANLAVAACRRAAGKARDAAISSAALSGEPKIAESTLVDPSAELGVGVTIGPFTVVHAGVRIGDGTAIGSHCVIGHPGPGDAAGPLTIGPGATIRSHSVLYEGSTFGERLETGHHVTLREGLTVGANLRVGTYGDLQGDTTIGDYCRFHSNVFVAKYSAIGDFVWIFPHAMLANDPHPPSHIQLGATIDDYAVVGAGAMVLSGIRVGGGAVVGAASVVTRAVPADELVVGVPARTVGAASAVKMRDDPLVSVYPWTAHYHRGYPDDVVAGWNGGEPD